METKPTYEELQAEIVRLKQDGSEFKLLFKYLEQGFALHEMVYDENGSPIDYRFVMVNDAFENLTGLKREELIGKTVMDILPGTEKIWIENYGKVAQTGKPYQFENYSQELSKYYNVVAYSPKKDFFAVVFSDVTQNIMHQKELIKAKEKAEEKEKRLSVALSAADSGIWDWNLITNEVYFDPYYYTMAGYASNEFPSAFAEWKKRVHPDDFGAAEKAITSYISGEAKEYKVEFRFKTKNNGWMWILSQGKISKYDDKGTPVQFIGTHINIDKITKANNELLLAKNKTERSEEHLKQINTHLNRSIDMMPTAYILWDTDLNALEWNKAAETIFGYSRSEMIGNNPIDYIVPEEIRLIVGDVLKKLKVGDIADYSAKDNNIHKDGSYISCRWFNTPLVNDKGDVFAVLTIALDITKQIESEENLIIAKEKAEESDRLKSSFLANMSHEIRTPMNAILGFSNLLKKKNVSEDRKKKYLELIEQGGNRLLHLISDIVDVSKIDVNQLSINYEACNVNNLIDNLQDQYKIHDDNKGCDIVITKGLEDVQSIISTDEKRLFQIISNLIENALKFTKNGNIEFGYNKKENMLEFFVKDTGIGIDKNYHQAIFDRFSQVDNDYSNSGSGTGLGLSIVKSLTELLGGKVWVESEIDKGAAFYFTIPHDIAEYRKKTPLQGSPKLDFGNEITILVAEDDYSNYAYLEAIFEDFQYNIVHAKNGEEAIEIVKNNDSIDIVLMDIQMPVLNGFEATKEIRKTNRHIPIIALTAYAMAEDKQKAFKAGCDDYIAKPISEEKLAKALKKHMKKRR